MKRIEKYLLTGLMFLLIGTVQAQDDCQEDLNYSVSNYNFGGGATGYMVNDDRRIQFSVGQPAVGTTGSAIQGISAETGVWGHYRLQPQAPVANASQGEYVDRVEVEWEIIDGYFGPPITGSITKVYRNGRLLTTVPLEQTAYVDYNVFPGEFYTYQIVSTNQFGESWPLEAIGFMQPNGRVTGKIETRTGAPVSDTKVTLSPNLGRSLELDGTDDYAFFTDQDYSINSYYTIEGWWRNVDVKTQTLIVAVDSGTTDVIVKISLDASGHLHYLHDGNADGTGIELITTDAYNLTAFDRDWHHFAAVYDTTNVYLYVDGNRVAEALTSDPITVTKVEIELGKDGPDLTTGFYSGHLDDFRIWQVGRERSDIRKFKDITLTGEEDYLQSYWKFDEQYSDKIFDFAANPVPEREHGYICGVTRSDFISPVELGAYSDEGGDYLVKGVYYGAGTTFSVSPEKETAIGNAMYFDGTDDMVAFDRNRLLLANGITIEGWFKTGAGGDQIIFASNDAETNVLHHQIWVAANGLLNGISLYHLNPGLRTFSTTVVTDERWHHYALTHEGNDIKMYLDGVLEGTSTLTWSGNYDLRYIIGRGNPNSSEAGTAHFNGLMDEMRIWDHARTETEVNATMNQIIPSNEQGIVDEDGSLGLLSYWNFNEGQGSIVSDLTPNGQSGNLLNYQSIDVNGLELVTNWEGDDIPLGVEYFIHDFDPNSRNVTLDPSNTSVDRVDFTDISQISVSGFLKFSNSDCFAPSVEMKINGSSIVPPVFTDEDGKFILELEPGTANAFLSAEFEGYVMDPGFIELPTLVRPISGLKFEVSTTRNIKGIVGGGECLFPTGTADIRIVSTDGCYEKTVTVNATTGVFEATNIPPIQYEVSVINHSDTQVQASFDLSGAVTVDVRAENDSIAFIYNSETKVRMTFEGAESNTCVIQLNSETATLLNQSSDYNLKIELFQDYGVNTCILSSGVAFIEDDISDFSPRDTVQIANGFGKYTFKAGVPNLAAPHGKSITVTGKDTDDAEATGFESVIVLGYKTLTSTFETTTPQLPLIILRDPPGDGSFAYLEQNEEVCSTSSFNYTKTDEDNTEFTAHMGPDITLSTGIFISKETEIDVTIDMKMGESASNSYGTDVEYETCLTSSEIFKTTDNDLLSDGEGDVFVGGAFNILVGTNRVINVNPDNCQLELEDVVMILPTNFATTYIYNQQYIESFVIPGLEAINDTESVGQWKSILAYNESLKASALFEENISFSGGIEFERSVTSSESSASSMQMSSAFSSEIASGTGLTVDGMGFSLGVSTASIKEEGYSKTSQKSTSKTVGYSLNDDDIGDNFSIDIKKDAQGMPVFDLVAGESMCPWEPGTKNRIAVGITPISATSVVDVPEDEPAVFKLALSNNAETAEDQFYELRVLQESNPNGATILINGNEAPIGLFIKANQSEEVTVTIEKGPDAYLYTDLELELFVPCELERAEGLGIDIADLITNDVGRAEFFSRQKMSVEFVKTCQDLTVFAPGDDWLVNNTSNNQLAITVSDINLDQTEFDQFKFQYRKQIEGEPFINGETVARASITGDSHSFNWDVTATDDALYELRLVSECNSGFFPGTSSIVSGRIDRVAPQVLGTASPVDAILNLDDEISITFEENLNCDAIISLGIPVSLTQGSMNNVNLSSTETSLSLAKDVSCVDNQLFIVPDIQNKFINGQVLRVDLLGLEDLYGNIQTDQITWEFNIDRDPLEWLGGDIQSVSYEGESPTFVRQIKNNGGFAVEVNLSGTLDVQTLEETLLPSWITATPRSFKLQSGGTQEVTFSISDQISGASYEDVVTAASSYGAPELNFDVRVLCPEPDWVIDESQFENSMTFTGQLDIRGTLSTDEYDIVAAFVGNELRGVGKVQHAPELENIPGEHPYLIFMTLYTNSTVDEKIKFQVWDASRCQLYGQIAETYHISLSTPSLGSPTNPVSVTVTNDIIQNIPLSAGWNWFSLNLNSTSSATDDLLGSLNNSRGDIVKSQNDFSQYVNGLGWVGPLSTMDSTQAFRIKLANPDTLVVLGEPIDFETTLIKLDSGWNWISFLPPVGLELNEALSGITATADFIIKSQTDFAQYVDFQGWIGSLDFLRPNQGYLIFTNRSASLEYPVNNANGRSAITEKAEVQLPEGWKLNPAAFEYNSNQVFTIKGLEVNEGDFIGLFNGDQLYGWGQARYLDFLDQHYFFVTSYGNEVSQELEVRVIVSGQEISSGMSINVTADLLNGSVQDPLVVDLSSEILNIDPETLLNIKIYPNPADGHSSIALNMIYASDAKVTLHNLTGQLITEVYDGVLTKGSHKLNIEGSTKGKKLLSGVYLVNIRIGNFITTKKLVIK